MNLAWDVLIQDLVQQSAETAPRCFAESVLPGLPCRRNTGPGDYQPLSVASSGIFSGRATPYCKENSKPTQLLLPGIHLWNRTGWKGSVRTTGSQSLLWCVARWQRAQLCRARGMAGMLVPRSLQSVRERGGAEGHLASSIAQRRPGSRAGGQDTALDPLQGLLNCAWSLRLALRYTRCTKRPCEVCRAYVLAEGEPSSGLATGGSEGSRKAMCIKGRAHPSPPTASADTGADLVLKISLALLEGWKRHPRREMAECFRSSGCLLPGYLIIFSNL